MHPGCFDLGGLSSLRPAVIGAARDAMTEAEAGGGNEEYYDILVACPSTLQGVRDSSVGEHAPVLHSALHSVQACKLLALQVSRQLFASGCEDTAAEESRAALLEIGDELDSTEARLLAALEEEEFLHSKIADLASAHLAAQTQLAEASVECDWLHGELKSTSEQLAGVRDKLYLQVLGPFHVYLPFRSALAAAANVAAAGIIFLLHYCHA